MVLVLTTLADLVLRAQVMSRAPLAVAIVAVPDVMARTHFGAILTARAAMLALAVLLSWRGRPRSASSACSSLSRSC